MRDDRVSIRAKGILVALIICLICSAGCIQIPSFSKEVTEIPQGQLPTTSTNFSTQMPQDVSVPIETPSPVSTPPRSNITDWNPYNVLPTPTPALYHTSILKNEPPYYRKNLNITYTGSVGLAGNAFGKDLNITTGPFAITYTVHPNISSPLDVWVKFTVLDPWQNVIAIGGYNRGYPNEETQTMTLYREGRYYLTIEGDFASVDYTIKTEDPVPVTRQTQTPVSSEEIPPEEMMRRMKGF